METRSGTSYQQTQALSGVTMNQQFEILMKTLNDQMTQLNQSMKDQMVQFNQGFDRAEKHLDTLERARHTHTKPKYEEPYQVPPNPRRAPYQNLNIEPNPRRPYPELVDQDKRTMRYVRLEAPTFDGCLDPKVYLDWEREMEQYFEWHEMTEGRKFRLAKTKLIRQARLYWGDVE